jgi:hypothetical protein
LLSSMGRDTSDMYDKNAEMQAQSDAGAVILPKHRRNWDDQLAGRLPKPSTEITIFWCQFTSIILLILNVQQMQRFVFDNFRFHKLVLLLNTLESTRFVLLQN